MPLAKITEPIATIMPITPRDKVVFGSDMGESAFVIFVEFNVGNNPFSPYHIFIQAIMPITRIIEPTMILLIPIIRSIPHVDLGPNNFQDRLVPMKIIPRMKNKVEMNPKAKKYHPEKKNVRKDVDMSIQPIIKIIVVKLILLGISKSLSYFVLNKSNEPILNREKKSNNVLLIEQNPQSGSVSLSVREKVFPCG